MALCSLPGLALCHITHHSPHYCIDLVLAAHTRLLVLVESYVTTYNGLSVSPDGHLARPSLSPPDWQ